MSICNEQFKQYTILNPELIDENYKLPLSATSIWTMRTATKRKLLVEGLTSGQQYVFRIAAAGSDPNRTWSDEIAVCAKARTNRKCINGYSMSR